jgi:hypothetical protein
MLAMVVAAMAGAGQARSIANTWAGVWDSDFGKMTLDAGGSGRYEGFSPGTLSGNVKGSVNEGTWAQPGNPPKEGTFTFTMSSSGRSFTGIWAYKGGGCGTACGWNGTCVSGACMKNGDAPVPPPKPPRAEVVTAVDWARDEVGSEKWRGRCQRFVETSYGARTGYKSAREAAESIGLRAGPATSVPKGALIYFLPNCPGVTGKYGHVGLSLGNGKMVSALGEVAVTDLRTNARWRNAYSGWTYPPASWPGR